ncbi:MAG: class I SAM-dependent methyltransferase [Deltaproteobacteria bacterium]|nr:class I SAM-dependent methyltransferase [Deltaproteobacteria bacterium]
MKEGLAEVAAYYDKRKVGHVGPLGFRRSTDMTTLLNCVDRLMTEGLIVPGKTTFLDLGCGDGRVNLFFSLFVRLSVGIEIDEWTLEEYEPARAELKKRLGRTGLLLPDNVFLFHGDSTDVLIHRNMEKQTGMGMDQFDLFYTYLIMHEEFAQMLGEKARAGAIFMVYGVDRIMPVYRGFKRLDHLSPMEGILALYQKV